jgi:hypothetical protein
MRYGTTVGKGIGFLAGMAIALGVQAAPAEASFGLQVFKGQVVDASGAPFTQAAAHPFAASATIEFNTATDRFGGQSADGEFKDVIVELPPGFVGDPTAVPRCPDELLLDVSFQNGNFSNCPANTQIGTVELLVNSTGDSDPDRKIVPLFNLEPADDEPARFGFNLLGVAVTGTAEIRTGGDYGATVKFLNSNQSLKIRRAKTTLWGVPADPAHDVERDQVCFGPVSGPLSCLKAHGGGAQTTAGIPRRPFLTTAMNCSAGPLTTTLRVNSWQDPGTFHTASFDEDVDNGNAPLLVEGCAEVPFAPSLSVRPTNREPDSPTGLEVELSLPQNENPDGLAHAHLKKTVVTLPEGMTVSPAAAHGLGACTSAQIDIDGADAPTCPASSKVGTLSIDTPLLDDPLTGSVYLARQSDNPFGSLLAIYLVAHGPGVIVKLAGKVDADSATGRLTTTFDDNPQLPFSRFKLVLKGGPTAPLATPPTCGPKTVTSQLSPWTAADPDDPTAAETVSLTDTFDIECPGLGDFAPSLSAGTLSPVGGSFSPFALRIERADRQEVLDGLSVELPEGLLAKLRGVSLCPEDRARLGSCDLSSRIGSVNVGAGPGATPFFLKQPGSVHLTGPYGGGPYGLAIVVRAVAGPFDLGTVVLRQSIHVDPVDAHLTAIAREAVHIGLNGQRKVLADPIPTIVEGIPLRLRTAQVDVDRPGFTVNPTSCARKQVRATLRSQQGSVANVASTFRVGDCALLPFQPRLSLRLRGPRQMRTGGHPPLRAVLTQGAGQANIESARVTLPKAVVLDPSNSTDPRLVCGYDDGLRADCPSSSIIGRATATTPLLSRPLVGAVHLVQGIRFGPDGRRIRTLPTLLVKLRGEVAIDLRAKTSVRRNRLVTTFDQVPDAPVSRFALTIDGGREGILVVTRTARRKIDLCASRRIADVESDAQNGRRRDFRVPVRTACAQRRPFR